MPIVYKFLTFLFFMQIKLLRDDFICCHLFLTNMIIIINFIFNNFILDAVNIIKKNDKTYGNWQKEGKLAHSKSQHLYLS